MTENLATYIGLMAALCTTVSFIPQVIQTLKTKHTKDISLSMYAIFTFGLICWLTYGIMTDDIPVIAANTITLALASTVLFMTIKHG